MEEPETLTFAEPVHQPHPYQQKAVDAIADGFQQHERGKLILPCGTGKSVVALWAAEQIVGQSGRVLYVVPSISLMGQTMREWSAHRQTDQRYIGVCSDSSAGRGGSENANLTELSIPVTTNPEAIRKALRETIPDKMTVVFSTYQSLQVIADAQADGAEPFDLMICDVAHRTTGVHKKARITVSSWLLPHDQTILQADRRLYMTATPRLYSANVKEKAKERQAAIYSMDDEATYGPEIYKMSFKKAVDDGFLSDYEVAVVAVSDSDSLFANLAGDFVKEHEETGVNVEDVVKLLGCWDALADPTTRGTNGRVTGQVNTPHAAQRAIAFSNTIKSSMNLEKWWPDIISRLGRLGAGGGGRRDHRVQARIDRGTQRNVPLLLGSGARGLPAILQRRRHPPQRADPRPPPPDASTDGGVDGLRGPGGLIPASARGFSPPINSLSHRSAGGSVLYHYLIGLSCRSRG